MYRKIYKTNFPPEKKPVMIWEGKCGFCHYWIIRWKKFTGDKVEYEPYESSIKKYPDIPIKLFKQAVRLIEPDGRIYNGAEAAFRTFTYGSAWNWVYRLYENSRLFKRFSHYAYHFISKRRPFFLKLTIAFWGKNPLHQKPYWALYLMVLFVVVMGVIVMSG